MLKLTSTFLPLDGGDKYSFTFFKSNTFYGMNADKLVRIRGDEKKELELNFGPIVPMYFTVSSSDTDDDSFSLAFMSFQQSSETYLVHVVINWSIKSFQVSNSSKVIRYFLPIDLDSCVFVTSDEDLIYMHFSDMVEMSLSPSESIFSRFLGHREKDSIISVISGSILQDDYLFCLCSNWVLKIFSLEKKCCIKSIPIISSLEAENRDNCYNKQMQNLLCFIPNAGSSNHITVVVQNSVIGVLQYIRIGIDRGNVKFTSPLFKFPISPVSNVVDFKVVCWYDQGQDQYCYVCSILSQNYANYKLSNYRFDIDNEETPRMIPADGYEVSVNECWIDKVSGLRNHIFLSAESDVETLVFRAISDPSVFSSQAVILAGYEFRKQYLDGDFEDVSFPPDDMYSWLNFIDEVVGMALKEKDTELLNEQDQQGFIDSRDTWLDFFNLVVSFQLELMKPLNLSMINSFEPIIVHASGVSLVYPRDILESICEAESKSIPLSFTRTPGISAYDSVSFVLESLDLIKKSVPPHFEAVVICSILNEGLSKKQLFTGMKNIIQNAVSSSPEELSSLKHLLHPLHDSIICSGALEAFIRVILAPMEITSFDGVEAFTRSITSQRLNEKLAVKIHCLQSVFSYIIFTLALDLWGQRECKLTDIVYEAYLVFQKAKTLKSLDSALLAMDSEKSAFVDGFERLRINNMMQKNTLSGKTLIELFCLFEGRVGQMEMVDLYNSILLEGSDGGTLMKIFKWVVLDLQQHKVAYSIFFKFNLLEKNILGLYLMGVTLLKLGRLKKAEDMFLRLISTFDLEGNGGESSQRNVHSFFVQIQEPRGGLFSREFKLDNDSAVFFLIDHLVKLFAFSKAFNSSILFCKLAIQLSATHKSAAVQESMAIVFTPVLLLHQLEVKDFEDAFISLCGIKDRSKKNDFLRMLVSSICDEITSQEHDDHHILFDYLFQRLPFADLENEFVEIIKTKAKFTNLNELFSTQSEKQHINYYKLLHSFFIFRGDFRNAAYSMHLYYSRLMKELDLSQDVEQRMIEAAQCLLVSLQNLTMIDEENRWLLDNDGASVLTINDINKNYRLILAKLTISKGNTTTLASLRNMTALEIVSLLLEVNLFDTAANLLVLFKLDLSPLFHQLCLRCAFSSSSTDMQAVPDVKDDSYDGFELEADKNWKLLKRLLAQLDDKIFTFHLFSIDLLLSLKPGLELPLWLISNVKKGHEDELIRILLNRGRYEDASAIGKEYLKKFELDSMNETKMNHVSASVLDKLIQIEKDPKVIKETIQKVFSRHMVNKNL